MQVFSYLMTLAKDRTLAEEITQETFFRAMTAKKSFRGESDVFTWLCAIAKNIFSDEMRKRKKRAEAVDAEPTADVDLQKQLADADTALRIHMVLHGLEEPYKEVFSLRLFGELSFKQIAAVFQKTESWARVTYHRAKLKILERMDEDEDRL